MATKRLAARPKRYTVAEANATLPLVRRIVEDITTLAHELRERYQRLQQVTGSEQGKPTLAHSEELVSLQEEVEHDTERLRAFVKELEQLGVELKDYFTGLVDFRSLRDGREVYLCWKLGEPHVAHWHELDAGFSGRQQLTPDVSLT